MAPLQLADFRQIFVCPRCRRLSYFPARVRVLGIAALVVVAFPVVLLAKLLGLGNPQTFPETLVLLAVLAVGAVAAGYASKRVTQSRARYLVK